MLTKLTRDNAAEVIGGENGRLADDDGQLSVWWLAYPFGDTSMEPGWVQSPFSEGDWWDGSKVVSDAEVQAQMAMQLLLSKLGKAAEINDTFMSLETPTVDEYHQQVRELTQQHRYVIEPLRALILQGKLGGG